MDAVIGDLPDEILINIFSFLPDREIPRIALVCGRWKAVSHDGTAWQARANGLGITAKAIGETWRDCVIGRYYFSSISYLPSLAPYKLGIKKTTTSEKFDQKPILVSFRQETLVVGLRDGALAGLAVPPAGAMRAMAFEQPPGLSSLSAVAVESSEGKLVLLAGDREGKLCLGVLGDAGVVWGNATQQFTGATLSIYLRRGIWSAVQEGGSGLAFGRTVGNEISCFHQIKPFDSRLQVEGIIVHSDECRLFIREEWAPDTAKTQAAIRRYQIFAIGADTHSYCGEAMGYLLHASSGIHWRLREKDLAAGAIALTAHDFSDKIWSAKRNQHYTDVWHDGESFPVSERPIVDLPLVALRVGSRHAALTQFDGSIYLATWTKSQGSFVQEIPCDRQVAPHLPDLGTFFAFGQDGESELKRFVWRRSGPQVVALGRVPPEVARGCAHVATASEWFLFPDKQLPEPPPAPTSVPLATVRRGWQKPILSFTVTMVVSFLLLKLGPPMARRLSLKRQLAISLGASLVVTWLRGR